MSAPSGGKHDAEDHVGAGVLEVGGVEGADAVEQGQLDEQEREQDRPARGEHPQQPGAP